LLEFNYILKAFNTIEDAIRNFDKTRGEGVLIEEESVEEESQEEEDQEEVNDKQEPGIKVTSEEDPDSLETEEKVKRIALENPSWGASKLSKELNTEKYGFERVNVFSVWKMLRKLGLGSQKDREAMSRKKESPG
jgi:hypothetical protein